MSIHQVIVSQKHSLSFRPNWPVRTTRNLVTNQPIRKKSTPASPQRGSWIPSWASYHQLHSGAVTVVASRQAAQLTPSRTDQQGVQQAARHHISRIKTGPLAVLGCPAIGLLPACPDRLIGKSPQVCSQQEIHAWVWQEVIWLNQLSFFAPLSAWVFLMNLHSVAGSTGHFSLIRSQGKNML